MIPLAKSTSLNDPAIREYLLGVLAKRYRNSPNTIVLQEFELAQGETRVDLAVINGSITGIEIKSDRDCLERLPRQVQLFSTCLDFVELFVGETHVTEVVSIAPDWCGVTRVFRNGKRLQSEQIRSSTRNHRVDSRFLVQLLWREEAMRLLSESGITERYRSKTRAAIWDLVVELIPVDKLQRFVLSSLKKRNSWRLVPPHK